MSSSIRSGPAPRRSWWSQNRKWILASLAGVFALLLFVAGLVFWVLSMIRDSTVTRLAMAYAKQDTVIQQKLGTPIELGWLMSGSIQTSGSSGRARLALPLRGPKGSGVLYALADREGGEWRFSTLVMKVEGESEPVDLLRDQSRGT